MKVLHILSAYFNASEDNFEKLASHGGAERYALELANECSKHNDVVTLLTFGSERKSILHGNLKIEILPRKKNILHTEGKSYYQVFTLFNYIRNYDVVHAHQYYTDPTMLSAILTKLLQKNFYVTDLGARGLTVSRYFPSKYFCKKFLGITNYDQKAFKIPARKFESILGGVDLDKYNPKYSKKKQIIFVGRFLPHKGIEYVIDSVDPTIKCIIAGHPYQNDYYKQLITHAKNKPNINFIIDASDNQIVKLLQDSMALVLPSVDIDYNGQRHKNPELFGLVIAEAFACGTPAIVSNSSALPYVVDNNKTGYIVPQNDHRAISNKINLLVNNPVLVQKLGKNARKKVETDYNWANIAIKCQQIYES